MNEQLKEQIRNVVGARERAQRARGVREVAVAEWEKANNSLLVELSTSTQEASEAEDILRKLTLQVYSQTGDKSPVAGVGIREVTKLEYDARVALDWAMEHKMALKLDASAFAKIAKVSPPNFVEVMSEPQATIATRLEIVD